jgi:secreted trypsin-like serine protease
MARLSILLLALVLVFAVTAERKLNVFPRRIVGGQAATVGQFDYQIAWIDKTRAGNTFQQFFCGGSLIAPNLVLTAGHCFRELDPNGDIDTSPSTVSAVVGTINLDGSGEIIDVSEIYVHPNWNFNDYLNYDEVDLCVVRLASNSNTGTPVTLANANQGNLENDGTQAIVSGWGVTSANTVNGQPSQVLRYVQIPLVDSTTCQASVPNGVDILITENYICAGEQNQDACFGDSGGPLVIPSAGNTQVGVVSAGTQVTEPLCGGEYGTYSRIIPHRAWIDQCVDCGGCCIGLTPSDANTHLPALFLVSAIIAFLGVF